MEATSKWVYTEKLDVKVPFAQFERLRRLGKLVDLKIMISSWDKLCINRQTKEGIEVSAHRFLIAARFPAIEDIVTEGGRSTLEWRRFSTNIVEAVITYAYTGRVEFSLDNASFLYLIATNLGCSSLVSGCIEFLRSRLSKDNVKVYWSIANATMNKDLLSACVPVIASNFDSFSKHLRFPFPAELECLVSLMSDSRLSNVTVDAKLRAILAWLEAATTADEKVNCIDGFKDLISILDLKNLSPESVVDLCSSKCGNECKDHIVNAWKLAIKSSESPNSTLSMTTGAVSFTTSMISYIMAYSVSDGFFTSRQISSKKDVDLNVKVVSNNGCEVAALKDRIYLVGGRDENGNAVGSVKGVNPFDGRILKSHRCSRQGCTIVLPRSKREFLYLEESMERRLCPPVNHSTFIQTV